MTQSNSFIKAGSETCLQTCVCAAAGRHILPFYKHCISLSSYFMIYVAVHLNVFKSLSNINVTICFAVFSES